MGPPIFVSGQYREHRTGPAPQFAWCALLPRYSRNRALRMRRRTYGSTHHALPRGLAIWSQKVASCAKAISLRKFFDLKSMPRTVGSLRLRAVQLRRPLSPSREAHVFDRPPLTQRTLMGVDDPRFPQGRGRCCSRSWRVDFKVEIITQIAAPQKATNQASESQKSTSSRVMVGLCQMMLD